MGTLTDARLLYNGLNQGHSKCSASNLCPEMTSSQGVYVCMYTHSKASKRHSQHTLESCWLPFKAG